MLVRQCSSRLQGAANSINSHRFQGTQGNLTYNTVTVQYAAAYLLQASPTQLCPYYNNTIYSDPSGNQWQVYCGFVASGPAVASVTAAAGELRVIHLNRPRKLNHLPNQIFQAAFPNVQLLGAVRAFNTHTQLWPSHL